MTDLKEYSAVLRFEVQGKRRQGTLYITGVSRITKKKSISNSHELEDGFFGASIVNLNDPFPYHVDREKIDMHLLCI